MLLHHRHSLAALTLLLCTGVGGTALAAAQNNPPRPAPNAAAPNGAAQAARADARDARLEGRLAYLKAALKITAAQDQVWEVYADAVRNDTRARAEARPNPPPAPRARPSLVDGLAARQQRLAAESARLDRMVAALKPLYAALSDDQRRMADRLLAPGDGRRAGARMPPRFAWDPRFDRRFYR